MLLQFSEIRNITLKTDVIELVSNHNKDTRDVMMNLGFMGLLWVLRIQYMLGKTIALTIFKFNVFLQVLTMLINNYMIINVMHILSIATA